VRNISFNTVMRGYDRDAVDAYIERVNRLIAELEIGRSPESAVKHAVAQVSEETRGILERAHETAEEITARSRARADDRLQEAEREAAAVREAAEARVRELDADAEAIWNERVRLIDDVRDVAQRLLAVADEAVSRFPTAHPEDETQALPAGAPLEAAEIFDAEAEPAGSGAGAGSHEPGPGSFEPEPGSSEQEPGSYEVEESVTDEDAPAG